MTAPQHSITDGPELVVGLVGAVGTDLSLVTSALTDKFISLNYKTEIIKLSGLLEELADYKGKLKKDYLYDEYDAKMTAGTEVREKTGRGDALAMLAMMAIQTKRATIHGEPLKPVPRHAFVLHSLKHPGEVRALREVYGVNFLLLSAYTPERKRHHALATKLSASLHTFHARDSYRDAQDLLHRDEFEDGKEFGQQVRKTFPLADVFVDASAPDRLRRSIGRFIEVVFKHPYHTPTRDEYGMFHAQAAANRSSAMGRQVGAAVTTLDGDVVVVGTNEVPKAGGGLYWDGDEGDNRDYLHGHDINDVLKRRLLEDVLQRLRGAGWLAEEKKGTPIKELVTLMLSEPGSEIGKAQIMSVIEYGRCVHAEMAAIVDAARRGTAVAGCTLYTTTFPCHECARHVIAAGIRRVVYIDPYPKSMVLDLHGDSIVLEEAQLEQPKVLFQTFVGIAPRMYLPLFQAPKRKDDDGKAIPWAPQSATPRYVESTVALLVREEGEVQRFNELMVQKGLLRSDASAPKSPDPTQMGRGG